MRLGWDNVSIGVYALFFGGALGLGIARRRRRTGKTVPVAAASTGNRRLVALATFILRRPRAIAVGQIVGLFVLLAYPLATAPMDIDLDTASLRVVSGELTSRQDSLNLLQETNALWRTEYKHAIMTPATPDNRRALNGGDGADGSIKGADGGKQRYQREGDGEESGEESNLPANQTQAAADAEDDPDDLSSHPQGRDAFLTIYYSAANGRRQEGLTGHLLATKRLAHTGGREGVLRNCCWKERLGEVERIRTQMRWPAW